MSVDLKAMFADARKLLHRTFVSELNWLCPCQLAVTRLPRPFGMVAELGQPFRLFATGERLVMCDYSLQHVASRPAKVGDKLITSSFQGSMTHGFAAVGEPDVAVCLLRGTEIAFEEEVKHEGIFRWKRTVQKTAIFRQLDKDRPNVFHDALEFSDGRIVLLTHLGAGLRATVLQLPVTARTAENAKAQQRADFVG